MYRGGHGYEYYNPNHHQNLRINTHSIPLDDQTSMTHTPDTAILMPSSYDRYTGSAAAAAAAADPYSRIATARSRTTDSPQPASRPRKPSQKEMLSRALQKANTAVELDNVQNFEGARRAYIEASELLDQVIMRVGVEDVRRRLEEIRDRYTSRIEELDSMGQLEIEDEKELPARPERDSTDFMFPQNLQAQYHEEIETHYETETPRTQNSTYCGEPPQPAYHQPQMLAVPERQQRTGHLQSAFSTSPSANSEWGSSDRMFLQHPDDEQYMPRPLSPYRGAGSRNPSPNYSNGLMPRPPADLRSEFASQNAARDLGRKQSNNSLHTRARSQDSWLDHGGGSGESTVSSLHSRSSSMQHPSRQSMQMQMQMQMQPANRGSEFEFDAALDAAVEAAYDDPYEPLTPVVPRQHQQAPTMESEDPVVQAMRNVEQAKERVRQTQVETSRLEQERQLQRDLQQQNQQDRHQQEAQLQRQPQQNQVLPHSASRDFFDDANSSDEEPIVASYKVDDYDANRNNNYVDDAMSPQMASFRSRSDNLATRTWFSTGTSAPPSATFPDESNSMSLDSDVLSLAPSELETQTQTQNMLPPPPEEEEEDEEAEEHSQSQSQSQALHEQAMAMSPDNGNDLAHVPKTRNRSRTASTVSLSVRNRRLSGQNPKQLMIETQPMRRPSTNSQINEVQSPDVSDVTVTQEQAHHRDYDDEVAPEVVDDVMEIIPKHPPASAPPVPVTMGLNMYSTPPMTLNEFEDIPEDGRSVSPISSRVLRKNYSSTSLRSTRTRNMSVSNIDDISDMSPGTPASTYAGRSSNYPNVPTPLSAAFADHVKNESTEAVYFSDAGLNHINSRGSAGMPISPRPGHAVIDPNVPVALEPCPNDFLLRPFWMMRCLYQTLCHPRGGFISNKLFVPRDVWKVKGVKIKNVDDKVQACDALTAALEKLGRVDTNDADNMLEEMQSLENVLDQLTQQLTRKLGGDVGIQAPSVLFRESSANVEAESGSAVPRSTSVSNKTGSSFSWRRLRSKTSQAGLTSQYSSSANGMASTSSLGGSGASVTMRLDSSHGTSRRDSPPTEMLPMTTTPILRPPRRDVKKVQFSGPNSVYMEALARLFDAAQTVDQIARQVEDPGLKHADKTQVGLELCTRHAAEFFAFYIIRFAMADLANLLDKFVKRGTEWATT
ncbi:hypothetical protein TD95_003694 [Thielaviopsis punctulata]|uniref:MIT domain-containing protein n=1 Tax=Thielaviopsis punctulata TaxID=72032 RepID=A0A0F4ZBU5_9PEZI|nr:hypothetical protein TD95_003694 [Thielaviopsis punctulata]